MLESLLLAGVSGHSSGHKIRAEWSHRQQYFAAAWAIRRVVFPILKGLFENVLSYQVREEVSSTTLAGDLRDCLLQVLHGPVHDWIDQIKMIFYGCMIYVAVGVCGALGAIFEIMILLWM